MGASSTIQVIEASATTAAVIVALWTANRALRSEHRTLQSEGRRQVALKIAMWLQDTEGAVLAWHQPENWRVSPDTDLGLNRDIKPGEILPPSQGRMGPSLEAVIKEFDSVRGSARLAFGPKHEAASLLEEVINATQDVADRGVFHADGPGPTPREYVDKTFRPLIQDLFEALAEACSLREKRERVPRRGVTAARNKPRGYR